MGLVTENYCDGCGDSIGRATLIDAVQLTSLGTNGQPTIMFLCMKYEEPEVPEGEPYEPRSGKIKGCARKVLSKATLGRLYEDVAAVTGDESLQPFAL